MLQITLTVEERDLLLALIDMVDSTSSSEVIQRYIDLDAEKIWDLVDSIEEKLEDA